MSPRTSRLHPGPRPWLPWLLAALTVAALLGLAALRPSAFIVWGDEGSYLAMAESLARDGDLRFDERDAGRLRARAARDEDPGRATVILQRTTGGVAYSKPAVYPLLAAPFYLVLGEWGPAVFNAVALGAALLLAGAGLRRLTPAAAGRGAALTVVTFAGAGALLPYVVWRMSEATQVALALAGLCLATTGLRRREGEGNGGRGILERLLAAPWAPYLGGALLGLLAASRVPNATVAAAPLLAAVLVGRWRRALGLAAAAAGAFLLVLGLTVALGGGANPYKAVRATFSPQTGYPAGAEGAAALERFTARPATHDVGVLPRFQPLASAYSGLYMVFGRHTGALLYLPAALVLLACALRRPDGVTFGLLAGAAGLALFYLLWYPHNYFGGATTLGNRYILPAYPALLLAPRRLPSPRALAVAWLLAAVAFASAAVSVARTSSFDTMSQNHASAGFFRGLPYETTAAPLDGRRDRYWYGDFLRFVDPYAEVGENAFHLTAGRPPAEVVLASRRPGARARLLVRADAPDVVIEFRDWLGRRNQRLASPGGASGIVEIELSPAWRYHSFWWAPGTVYPARTFRLALRAPDGGPARAEVRYLGDGAAAEGSFARRVLAVRLPARARAGSTSTLGLRVRNTSPHPWDPAAPLPARLGYRLAGPLEEGEAAGAVEGEPIPLAAAVAPGETATLRVPVTWPRRPGRYRLTVDLVLEPVAWFAERVGEPLARGEVEVVRPGDRPAQPRTGAGPARRPSPSSHPGAPNAYGTR